MAKGGGKGAGAKAAKSAHEEQVKAQKQKELEDAEAAQWADGAKDNKASKKEKAEKAAAAKAERERLLKEEEEQEAKKSSAKASKPAPPKSAKKAGPSSTVVPEFSARNIDDALDLLDIANEKTDKASLGAKAAKGVDAHPERRFKAAFEAYKENELPVIRKEQPGLRLQQYHDLLYKQFQKHPDNPFNQVTVSYDATKEDKVAALQTKKKDIEERLKTN
ncbi:hypothetical protein PCANC_01891 [Puccinia coronata f. sp. avenae]|uniref:DUF1014-domain-containing protein n=1 Tax=Puccinia coronata f. sp. avenae TaxID=200324 RepID=A0A2N5W4C9_9BASI|nr:hypothetical protein PCASD_24614 [Puccinia coronata f. sp. avenae]PLW34714.1 hypothetical protein PCASD_19486 [Puccinia coronata f. sp. avenae]PLW57081.1 hypothetical protein PCANC_01891 [Puccinia coronata f. sp. avenae]